MIFRNGYDHDWDVLARTEPFFAVLTDRRYLSGHLTAEDERHFWASGEEYVSHLAALFLSRFGRSLAPARALDFGCGVGRLLLPIARISRAAVGVDISPAMIALARGAAERAGLQNASFESSIPSGQTFDFVNSALVFQHIPVPIGLRLMAEMLDHLAPGGLLALQVLYARPGTTLRHRAGRWLHANVQPVHSLRNWWCGESASAPYMQMNPYPLGDVLRLLAARGLAEPHLILSNEHGFEGALILARKRPAD